MMRVSALVVAIASLTASSAAAEKAVPAKTRFYARAGVLHLMPNVDSSAVSLQNLDPFARLAIEEGPIAGSGVDVGSQTLPAMIVGYVLPVLDGRLSVETILAAPLSLELKATGTLATESLAPFVLGNIPTGVPPLGEQLGTAKALPPTVTFVYRFLPEKWFHPYAGLGLTYMRIFDAKLSNPVIAGVGEPTLEIDDAFGGVLQAGIEAKIHSRFYAFLDIKSMVGLSMTATIRDVYVETPLVPLLNTARVGDATVDIDMLPVIVMLGAGANF